MRNRSVLSLSAAARISAFAVIAPLLAALAFVVVGSALPANGAPILTGAAATPALSAASPSASMQVEETLVQYTPEELEAAFQRLQTNIMSPYCQGLTLADCPTSGAVAMRERIRAWLVEGHSEEWIMEQLVAEFGEWIRSAPAFAGFGLLAWLTPGAALILGGVWIGAYMRRQTGEDAGDLEESASVPDEGPAVAPVAADEARFRELEKRVEAELDAFQA